MIEVNNQGQDYIKPGAGAIIGGCLAGSAVSGLVASPIKSMLTPKIIKKMNDISHNLTEDEFRSVSNAIDETLKKTGLADKGVGVIRATKENAEEISNIINKEINNNFLAKHLPEQSKKKISELFIDLVKYGQNAFYTFKSKKIIAPEKDLQLALFHEMGHAANQNLSKIGSVLQKCRNINALGIPIALIALFKTKKAPNQEPSGGADKVTTFVKENAGKLTFATFLPMLIEEGMASIKGQKFAQKVLSPELVKKVTKTNALGFASYLGIAAFTSLGVYLGVKVKDAIAKPKLVEQK